MKRPRVRISTLMFLIVIAALLVALVLEKRRSARLLIEAQAERARANDQVAEVLLRAIAKFEGAWPECESRRDRGPLITGPSD